MLWLSGRQGGAASSRVQRWTAVSACSILFMTYLVAFSPQTGRAGEGRRDVDCDIQQGPCTRALSNRQVTLDILPRPVKAMQDLVFRVTISGERPTGPPTIDLEMPGMKMGPNRVLLEAVGEGVYEGTGVIVRCPSGRRTWQAIVSLPGTGVIRFTFDVVY